MTTAPNMPGDPRDERPVGLQERDLAQESLQSALRAGFNVLLGVMVVLVILYLASGIFQVETGESGLIARFGKLRTSANGTPVFTEGWHLALPAPFDEQITIEGSARTLAIDTFCFARDQASRQSGRALATIETGGDTLTPGVDGAMFTGDRNLSHAVWTVQYRIARPQELVENVWVPAQVREREKPEGVAGLLQRVAEGTILRVVSGIAIEDILLERQAEVARAVQERLQEELDHLQVGVEVLKVTPEVVEPRPVRQAFLAVTQAQNERQTRIEEAHAQAAEALTKVAGGSYAVLLERIAAYGEAQALGAPQAELDRLATEIDLALDGAGGEVAVLLRDAQSQANATREQISREYEEFVNYLEQYRGSPQVTALRLWLQMIEPVLTSKGNEIFFVPQGDEIEIIVNRDPRRLLEAERERYRQQGQR
jgi:membrane protease subunit HflK